MNREVHVRNCEGVKVRFPCAIRRHLTSFASSILPEPEAVYAEGAWPAIAAPGLSLHLHRRYAWAIQPS